MELWEFLKGLANMEPLDILVMIFNPVYGPMFLWIVLGCLKGIYAAYASFIAHRARGWLYSVDGLVSQLPSDLIGLKNSETSSSCVTVMVFDKLTI